MLTFDENRVRIRIGDAARVITGPARFRIRYRVERAILWERNRAWAEAGPDPDRAVLRWVATGTEWGVPIRGATVTVHLPRDLDDTQLDYDAWTGALWVQRTRTSPSVGSTRGRSLYETGALRPGESITIDVTMPADAVARAAWTRELLLVAGRQLSLRPVSRSCWPPAWRAGSSGAATCPAGARSSSTMNRPTDSGPAEVGTLIDERVDLRDISAVIIDLAVRGYLKIAEVASDSWLSSRRDYRFTRLKEPDDLKPFERQLFSQLFDSKRKRPHERPADKVLPGDRPGQERPLPGPQRARLFRRQSRDGPDDVPGPRPDRRLAAAIALAALVQTWMIGRIFLLPLVITAVLSAIVVVFTSRVMPRKTRKGRIAWEQIAGLEEYIRRAEVDDIQAQDRRGIFERLLPYAMIFGLSDRWAKAFADLYTQPPDWYQPVDPSGYTTSLLMRDLDRSVSTMNTTFPSMPRSSRHAGVAGPTGQGYGWSSGGFGGGGSSGGGFGGGGGGSW